MGPTHPRHSAVSAPCRGRSGRGCGPVWTSPGLTPLPTDAVGKSGPRPQTEHGCPCPCPPWGLGHSPATMSVKSKPFFTDLRCTWLGSVAKPTYCLSTSWRGWGRSGACSCSGSSPGPCPYRAQARGQQGRVPRERGFSVAAAGEGLWVKAPLRWEAGGPGGWWCPQGLHRGRVSAWSGGNRHIQ